LERIDGLKKRGVATWGGEGRLQGAKREVAKNALRVDRLD